MSYSKRSRYSRSPSYDRYRGSLSRSLSRSRSRSRSISRSRSRSYDSTDVDNSGNNLYVTGLSHRITKRDLEKHFSAEGTVEDVHLVIDPWTRESRGFGFVTMSSVKEAERCIKFLDRSVLEGRVITVEKARRRRGRTPTPGRYCGLRAGRVRHRSSSSSPYGSRSRSPCFSLDRYRSQSRSYSPYYRHRSYLRSSSPYSRSPIRRERPYSPDDRYYRSRRHHARSYRSISRSISRRSYSRSISPLRHRRSYSRSISPPRYRRRYSRSITPRRSRRSYYRSVTPRGSYNRRSRSYYRSISPRCSTGRQYYYSRSRSASASSRSVSRSVSSRSASPSP